MSGKQDTTVKEMLTEGDSRGATSQDPTSGKKEKRRTKGAYSKIKEATITQSPVTEESPQITSSEESSEESSEQSSQASQETNPNTKNKKKKSKFPKNVKISKILPFQGKSRFPMWIEVLKKDCRMHSSSTSRRSRMEKSTPEPTYPRSSWPTTRRSTEPS